MIPRRPLLGGQFERRRRLTIFGEKARPFRIGGGAAAGTRPGGAPKVVARRAPAGVGRQHGTAARG